MPLLQSLQNCVNGRARHLRLNSAQHIVGADFEDHGIGTLGYRPIQPRQYIRGGVAGNAGIDHLGGDPPFRRAQLAAAARSLRSAADRALAVSELPSATVLTGLAAVGRRGRDGHSEKERNATNSRMHDVAQRFATPI